MSVVSMGLAPATAQSSEPVIPRVVVAAKPTDSAQLTQLLADMDAAANAQKLSRYMRFYGPGFTHSDGFTRASIKQTTKAFWQQYTDLNYSTTLIDWEPTAQDGITVTTRTKITGRRSVGTRSLQLDATIESQQQWINNKLIQQTVLSEESQLLSGDNPPDITVQLPQTIKAGDDFNFDVILDEPLGERVVLGTALAAPVTVDSILNTPALELEPLPAGGLFKIGTVSKQSSDQWISAVLVQEGGMTVINRRLRIVK